MAAYAAELKNGATATYTFSFERISDDYVKVQHLVNGTWTDVLKTDATHPWSITGSTNTITMTGTQFPAGTGTVRIYRETPLTDLPVEFQSGSALAASQLNENYEQNFQAIQEISDHFLDKQTARLDGNVDMNNNDLLNVKAIQFEGSTVNDVHTTLSVLDPDTNKTINLPNVSGTVPVMETVPTAHIQATVAEIDQLHDVTDGTVAASKFVAVSADKDITGFRDLSISRNLDVDGNIDVDGTANVDGLDVDGNADISGNTVLHGNVQLGDAASDEIDFQGQINSDLVPLADNTRSLGTSAKQWKDLHINGTAEIDQLNADSVDINAGNIDDTTIGATTAAEATVTNLSVTGNTTLGNADTDDVTFTASLNSDIVPKTDDSRSLGSTSKKFANVHSTAFTGALSGNAASATTSAHVTITAEAGVDEENRLTFVEDAQGAGSQGLEVDNDLTWNPSSRKLTAPTFKGALEGKSDTTGKLHTAVNVAGVSFDGSAAINIPIENLSNVTVTNIADNQILKWDAAANGGNGQWVNEADGGSGGSGGSTDLTHTRTDTAVTVVSSTGSNVTIPAANASDSSSEGAGVMSKAQATRVAKTVLDDAPALHANLSVNGKEITSTSDGNIVINPHGNGTVELGAATTISTGGLTVTSGDVALTSGNVTLSAGGVSTTGAASVFNEGGADFDFRVEGAGQTHLLFVEAENDRVAINTDTTQAGKALTVAGDVGLSNGNTLSLMASANNNTAELGYGGSISYEVRFPTALPTNANRFLRATGNTSPITLEFAEVDTSSSVTTTRLEHSNTTNGFTIGNDSNAAMVGPLTINSGQTITVGNANSVFKIL